MVTWDDFNKIWASTSPLTPYEFSDQNYSQGWNFIGSTPPARQMWDSIQKKNDEKFKYLRDNFGTPHIVTQASDMTDTDMVYVYMGSEAGWNSGHWYYYDEGTSSWADGGVYNSVAFVTDTTLSIAGQPADAKAVGDALALKADLAGCTFTGNVNVTADLSVTGISTLAGDVTASSDLSVAGDSSLTNLSVSGTTALAGTSTAPTPSADDNSTKIATTEYVQTEIKPIETDVTINDKRITNIEKLLQGNLYDYQTDSTEAYAKSVPAGAMPYAGLEQIGGKTVVMNQLEPNPTTVYTSNGTHALVSGTRFVAGHKYYMHCDCTGTIGQNTGASVYARVNSYNVTIIKAANNNNFSFIQTSDYDAKSIGTAQTVAGNCWIYVYLDGADSVTNIQIVDLTLMFGAGNEPSTPADYEAIFPSIYAYNAGTLLSAGVTEVVSKDSNNATLQTIPIPTAIRNLEGYGWSVGDKKNYVDFERKVYVQEVSKLSFAIANMNNGENYPGWGNSGVKEIVGNGINSLLTKSVWMFRNGLVCNANTIGNLDVLFIPVEIYGMTQTQWKETYPDLVVDFYIARATPIETDISQYLTDDNLIQVESGGTLTFENQHGDDYRLPVPSEETYMIDLQEAINNG